METVTTQQEQCSLKGSVSEGLKCSWNPYMAWCFIHLCVLFHPDVRQNATEMWLLCKYWATLEQGAWPLCILLAQKNTFLSWKFNWLYAKKCHRWRISETFHLYLPRFVWTLQSNRTICVFSFCINIDTFSTLLMIISLFNLTSQFWGFPSRWSGNDRLGFSFEKHWSDFYYAFKRHSRWGGSFNL